MVWREHFESFVAAIRQRLKNGFREYGDRSFHRHPIELLGEVQEELLDVNGWSFILWNRLQSVRRELSEWRCPHCGKGVDLTTQASLASVPDDVREPIEI